MASATSTIAELVTAQPDRLYRRLRSLGLAHHDAEDAAQSVVEKSLARAHQLRSADEGSACGWLDAIARSTAADFGRRAQREKTEVPERATDDATDAVCKKHDLKRAVARLSPSLARVLELSIIDNLSHAEIAVRLNVSEAAVRQRLRRARIALRSDSVVADLIES